MSLGRKDYIYEGAIMSTLTKENVHAAVQAGGREPAVTALLLKTTGFPADKAEEYAGNILALYVRRRYSRVCDEGYAPQNLGALIGAIKKADARPPQGMELAREPVLRALLVPPGGHEGPTTAAPCGSGGAAGITLGQRGAPSQMARPEQRGGAGGHPARPSVGRRLTGGFMKLLRLSTADEHTDYEEGNEVLADAHPVAVGAAATQPAGASGSAWRARVEIEMTERPTGGVNER